MNKDPINPGINDAVELIAQPFISYYSHHDRKRLQSDLNSLVTSYDFLDDPHDKMCFRQAMRISIERMLGTGDTLSEMLAMSNRPKGKPALSSDERLDMMLQALERSTPLMAEANRALSQAARYITDDELDIALQGEIAAFDVLKKYPALSTGTEEYVLATLDHAVHSDSKDMLYFPQVCGCLAETDFINLVRPHHLEAYFEDICMGSAQSYTAADVETLKGIKPIWDMIEALKPSVFATKAPALPYTALGSDREKIGAFYSLSYSHEPPFLLLDFNEAVNNSGLPYTADSDWVNKMDEDNLPEVYILLNHALGVLQGKRNGQTAKNDEWLKKQRDYLLPILQNDLIELEMAIGFAGLDLPLTPDVPPEETEAERIWKAHKAFSAGGPTP